MNTVSPWDWRPEGPCRLERPATALRLDGPDSLRFLHGQSSQDVALALPGQWLSTCCITPTARLRALAEVLVTADGAWLLIHTGDAAAVRQALDRVLFPADAVTLGPLQPGVLLEPLPAAGGAEARTWRPLEGGEGFWLGEQLFLATADGELPDPGALEPDARALLARRRLEPDEQERWRIHSGRPAWPAELNDDTNPFELGLADRVSLSKGCYVGQETLARLATYDGVRQQLRRWSLPGAAGPEPGTGLTADGERAGLVTTALALPDGDGWIGLALVRRGALAAETLLAEQADGPPLALQLSVPERFVAPPVGAGGMAAR